MPLFIEKYQYYKEYRDNMDLTILQKLQAEKKMVDETMMKISVEMSNIVIIVVDVLDSQDQDFIDRVQDFIKQTASFGKKVIIVHNLKKYTSGLLTLHNIYKNIGCAFNLVETPQLNFKFLEAFLQLFKAGQPQKINDLIKIQTSDKIITNFYCWHLEKNGIEQQQDRIKKQEVFKRLFIEKENNLNQIKQLLLQQVEPHNSEIVDIENFFYLEFINYLLSEIYCTIDENDNDTTHLTIIKLDSEESLSLIQNFQKQFSMKVRHCKQKKEFQGDNFSLIQYITDQIKKNIQNMIGNNKIKIKFIEDTLSQKKRSLKIEEDIKNNLFAKGIQGLNMETDAFKKYVKQPKYFIYQDSTQKNTEYYTFKIFIPKGYGINATIDCNFNHPTYTVQWKRGIEESQIEKSYHFNSRTIQNSNLINIQDGIKKGDVISHISAPKELNGIATCIITTKKIENNN